MGALMKPAPPGLVKNSIARLVLLRAEPDAALGRILLRPHQRDGVSRILRSLDTYRGALLCDEVGLGKTFTAAAVMRRFHSSVVIAPASLIPMWSAELQRARVDAKLVSLEKFSRSAIPSNRAELIVIDEAHHLRNPRTHRFRNVANYVDSSLLLLLTATPVHNCRADIVALISLFLGSRAATLSPSEFSECVIRRPGAKAGITGLPRRIHRAHSSPPYSRKIRHQILNLPPPVPPRDGAHCASLVQFTLLRQWASSDAALKAGLETRMARACVLMSALEVGTYPTRKEMSAWLTGGSEVQFAFPELVAGPGGDKLLLDAVRQHDAATAKLYRVLLNSRSSDVWRIKYLRSVRRNYPDRKIIAFTQFASTARGLFGRMRSDPGLAVITAGGCEIASGKVSRTYIIDRFAPLANGATIPPQSQEVSMVIATDLCSEGLNLQDASVLIHLDTPWTPARVEQRIGRIARFGGAHNEVIIHTVSVPEIADDLLRMADRLREKSALAASSVGADENQLRPDGALMSVPDTSERIIVALESWRRGTSEDQANEDFLAGAVCADLDCFVAVVGDGARNILVTGDLESVTSDPRKILYHMDSLSTEEVETGAGACEETERQVLAWLEQEHLESSLGLTRVQSHSRTRMARRINQLTAQSPCHKRADTSMLADSARRVVAMDSNAASEARVNELADSAAPDSTWLQNVSSLEQHSSKRKAESSCGSGFELRALLIGRRS